MAVGLCSDDKLLAKLSDRHIETIHGAFDLAPTNLNEPMILLEGLHKLQLAVTVHRAARHAFAPPAIECASEELLDCIPDLRHAGLPSSRSKRFECRIEHFAKRVDYLQLPLGVRQALILEIEDALPQALSRRIQPDDDDRLYNDDRTKKALLEEDTDKILIHCPLP